MHNTKALAPESGVRDHFHFRSIGYKPTSKSSKESMTAPLRNSRNRHTAPTRLRAHEYGLVPQAHTMGTALKTGVHNGEARYLGRVSNLKASKELPYRNPLSTTVGDAVDRAPSKYSRTIAGGSKEHPGEYA